MYLFDAGDVIVTPWPCTITGYPARGQPFSWSEIFEFCRDEFAVKLHLHQRRKTGPLQGELTLKGPWVVDAMKYVWQQSLRAGLLLDKVPPTRIDAEDLNAEKPSGGAGANADDASGAASSSSAAPQEPEEDVESVHWSMCSTDENRDSDKDDDVDQAPVPAASSAPVVPSDGAAESSKPATVVVPSGGATAKELVEPARWQVPYSGPRSLASKELLEEAKRWAATVSERQTENVAKAANGLLATVRGISMQDWERPPFFGICLCTTSYCRGAALIKSLAINLATLQFYAGLVHWVVVSFEDDIGQHEQVKTWIDKHARWAIASGILIFREGCGMKQTGWHASVGKNTAHRVAKELLWNEQASSVGHPTNLLLVNLDGDNLPGQGFIQSVMRECAGWLNDPIALWYHGKNNNQGGTCGRICCWARDFFYLNGLDEELLPMGYQDIDLLDRLGELQKKKFGQKYIRRVVADFEVGEAIPNNEDRTYAVGAFKLEYTAYAGQMTYGAMNKKNQDESWKKTSEGRLIRNTTPQGDNKPIGLPTRVVYPVCGAVDVRIDASPAKKHKVAPRGSSKSAAVVVSLGIKICLPGHNTTLGRAIDDVDHHRILAALEEQSVPGVTRQSKVYMFHCTQFKNPKNRNLSKHVGWNPDIIKGVVTHHGFKGWLLQVRDTALKSIGRDHSIPVLVFVCNKGRHRSVACTSLVSHCLETVNKVNCTRWHLASYMWHRGTCDGCSVCTGKSALRDIYMEKARQYWVA